MSFRDPAMLFLLWALPVLALFFWYGRSRRRALLGRFMAPALRESLAPGVSEGRRTAKSLLLLGCLLCCILALGGLRYGHTWENVERRGVSLVIALDCSRSMLAEDIAPTRLERAKREIVDLLQMLRGDQVGLVSFAGDAFLQCPMTMDYSGFHIFLEALTPDFMPVGGTDLAAAVRSSVAAFDPKDPADKAVLLITDGEHTSTAERDDALAAAREAAEQDVRIYAIGVGSPEPTPVPDGQGGFKKDDSGNIVLTRLDEDTLQAMARATGGAYARSVAGDMDLEAIYEQSIRADLEAATLSGGRRQVYPDRYRWLLAPAVMLLLAELLLPAVRRRSTGLFLVLLALAWLAGPSPARAENAAAVANEGVRSFEQGNFDAATERLLKAQTLAPDDPELAYNLGAALYRQQRYADAARQFGAAAEAAAEAGNTALQAKALYNSGNAMYRQNQLEEAAERYRSAYELAPDDQDALTNYAYVQQKLQEQQQQQQQNQGGDRQQSEDGEKQQGDQQQDPEGEKQQGKEQDQEQGQDRQDPQAADQQQDQGNQGRNQDEEDGGDEQQSPQYADTAPEDLEQPGQPSGQQPQPQGDPEREQARRQAEQAADESMLNRLQDKPGAALMRPRTNRNVEKDW